MKIPLPYEFTRPGAPQAPAMPSHPGLHVTVITMAIVAAFALGAMQGDPPEAAAGSALEAAAPEPALDEPPAYFPAQYVNEGVDVPAHIEAF